MADSGAVNVRSQNVHTPTAGIVPIHLTTRRFRCGIFDRLPHFTIACRRATTAIKKPDDGETSEQKWKT